MHKLLVAAFAVLFMQVQNVVADYLVIPVAPNFGTEIRSLPYTITSSGFYFLSKDLSINTISTAIYVNASDVTIDLLGHTIVGFGTGNVHGIFMQGRSNVEIRNGTIKNFGGSAVLENDNGGAGQNHRVLNVRVINNKVDGIFLAGKGHLVKGCTAANNGEDGIDVGSGSSVIESVSHNNVYDGILVGMGSSIVGSVSYDNNRYGVLANSGSTLKNNTAYLNKSDGIRCVDYCLIQSNTAYNNFKDIQPCPGCVIIENVPIPAP
jgi:hypothetical protein